ncbi:MAG: outer membrane beta-barrel protein [bacterium]
MRLRQYKMIRFYVLFVLIFLGISSAASAKVKPYVEPGFYFAIDVPYNTISGDFDGEKVLASSDGEVVAVPKIDNNYGFGGLVGYRNFPYSFELDFLFSEHNATWLNSDFKVNYSLVDFNMKVHFFEHSVTQPFLLFGLCFPELVIKEGSSINSDIGDVAFTTGAGLNIGAGISYYFLPKVAVNGGVVYRIIKYDSAEGISGEKKSITNGLGGSGLGFDIGVMFVF